MRQLLEKILRPGRNQLLCFGILVSLFLIFGLYLISFSWGFGFDFYIEIVYAVLLFLLLATSLQDRYNKTKLKRYVLLTAVLFTIYTLISGPTMNYLKSSSENQVRLLGIQIVNYKQQTGKYPVDLSDKFFENHPKRTYLGTRIFIDANNTDCYIRYLSLNGLTASFDIRTKRLRYYD